MRLLDKPETAAEAPPKAKCALCESPATGDAWSTPLCDAHWERWATDAPTAGAFAAVAQSGDVERTVPGEYLPSTVVLKPGVLERCYREWNAEWVRRNARARAA